MSTPGDLIAQRYRLRRLVGAGGMGVVWEGFDERLHRTVALKQLHPQPWLSDAEAEVVTHRALREARITARLNHPHAVPVYDVVEDQGRPCLVMQFLPSEPLSAMLQRRGPLTEPEVVELGTQLASALEAAHKVGIVHRDVKPGNVLVAKDGMARISDFGIAHALGDVTLTATSLVAGTPEYLAPEVARGEEPGHPADVFSLGATLYAALEGSPPFGTDTNRIALLHRVAAGVITAPRRSGALTSLLADMLAADPSERPSMSEVAARLAELRRTRGPEPTPVVAATTPAMEVTSSSPTVGMPARRRAELPPTAASLPAGGSDAGLPPRGRPARQHAEAPSPERRKTPQTYAATATMAPPVDAADRASAVPSSRRALPKARRRRRPPRGRGRLAAVLAAVLVLLVPLVLLVQSRGDAPQPGAGAPAEAAAPGADAPAEAAAPSADAPAEAAAPGAATSAPTTAAPTVAAAPPATPSPATRPSATASASAPSAAAPAPAPSPATAAAGQLTAAESARAVASYYSLLPGGTEQAWPLMTASYQTSKAGGRQSYQRFWDTYSRVTATEVSAVGPGAVEATITYYARDGRVIRERTQFGLVNQGGVAKINTSRVLGTR